MALGLGLGLGMPMASRTGGGPHPVAPWLLQTGVWNDAGVWLDSATWTEWLLNGGLWSDIGVWADTLTWDDGTPAFDAGGVNFDGATWLANSSLISDASDTVASFSMWVNITGETGYQTLWDVDPTDTDTSHNIVFFGNAHPYQVRFADTTLDNVFIGRADTVTNGAWHHVLVSADTNHAAGLKQIKIYVDGVDSTTTLTDAGNAFAMVFNSLPFWIGHDGFDGDQYLGDIAEFWFAPGQSLLVAGDIPPATIAKFYSGGSPVNLGSDGSTPTGTAPTIYMHRSTTDAASAFATNLGTGGSFATTGTLTASSTNP